MLPGAGGTRYKLDRAAETDLCQERLAARVWPRVHLRVGRSRRLLHLPFAERRREQPTAAEGNVGATEEKGSDA
jgi:hypothetical protein